MKLHHIGYATADIEKSIEEFKLLGYSVKLRSNDPIQNVNAAVMVKDNEPTIELITPSSDKNPVERYIKNGTGPYHVAYIVSDFDETIKHMRGLGYVATTNIIPAVAFEDRRLIFLYKPNVGIIELLEEDNGSE